MISNRLDEKVFYQGVIQTRWELICQGTPTRNLLALTEREITVIQDIKKILADNGLDAEVVNKALDRIFNYSTLTGHSLN